MIIDGFFVRFVCLNIIDYILKTALSR